MTGISRARASDEAENHGSSPSDNATLGDIIARRFHRRDLMKGALGAAAIAATLAPRALRAAASSSDTAALRAASAFRFPEVSAGVDATHHVAAGYDARVLIRWGDPVLPGAPAFDPMRQSAAAQRRQFGYNNDFTGYLPMPGAADGSRHGLLVVNLEYTIEELMFPGLGRQDKAAQFAGMTADLVAVEKAAHGGAVIEIIRDDNGWRVVPDSTYARRIDADTPITLTGPAAGHLRLRTAADPEGRTVRGMLNNCAGGITPWGTWLSCEENINGYFRGTLDAGHPEAAAFKRYGIPGNWYAWGQFEDRFDVSKEPNEANRFGWVVEIDPFDPASTPRKRTAMGRFKHEGAANIVNRDGRFVVYQGDDERFDYIYKFVTTGRVDPMNREANRDLLDDGTLYVARFEADGTGRWLPLVHGRGPLTAANGFAGQADVLIEARRAADLLGATRMDRPEDIEVNPQTHKVYAILTNNTRRGPDQVDAANPRAANAFGHIIELTPGDGEDHGATRFTWEILVRCGDPAIAAVGATFSSATSRDGWFGMPDNATIDAAGRLWIATDGNSARATGRADGLWALDTAGPARATAQLFFRCPAGAELCGPMFTPDLETLFVAVQHPGDDGPAWPAFGRASTFDDPSTRWPDFQPGMPPRPAVLAITRRGGGRIGG